jgi:hypothetical protein
VDRVLRKWCFVFTLAAIAAAAFFGARAVARVIEASLFLGDDAALATTLDTIGDYAGIWTEHGATAVRIAVDMVNEGLITREEAVLRVDPASLDQLLAIVEADRDALRARARAGAAVVVVSHRPEPAQDADRVLTLTEGVLK